ncbi:MAG: type II toxin-antitoxin system RelE/ParE family toxin [Actinomycetota bacterium]
MVSPVVLRQKASDDVDEIVAYYQSEAGGEVVLQFIDALEEAIGELGRHPLIGSLRFSYELDLPELRSWSIRGFPFVVFYVLRSDVVDVWRVVHAKRDLPAWLQPPEEEG